MTARKKINPDTIILENGSLERWVGRVDARLDQNDLSHVQILAELAKSNIEEERRFEELKEVIEKLHLDLEPLKFDVGVQEKQIELNNVRLSLVEPTIVSLGKEVSNMKGKLVVYAVIVSIGSSGFFLLAKALFDHIIK